MAVKFKIESYFKITKRGCFVAAKCMSDEKNFWIPKNSRLGEMALTTIADIPRALDENGNIRTDLWVFQLKNETDFKKHNEGELVDLFPGDKIDFLDPWTEVEAKGFFEEELARELSNTHPLFGKTVKAIARRIDNDDVLFEIGKEEMAVVHLTYSGNKEDSIYPRTTIYNHWTEVYEQVIVKDNFDYEL